MINTTTPQRQMSIEEAVATALPVDGNNLQDENVRTLINNMAGDGLQHISANPTHLSWRSEHPNLVIAQVDMGDYLRVQQELLDNPRQIQRYLEMLNPNARIFLEERARESQEQLPQRIAEMGRRTEYWNILTCETQCIRSIFGIDEGTNFLINLTPEINYNRRQHIMSFIQEVENRDTERTNIEYQRARATGDWGNYRGPEFCPHNFRVRQERGYRSEWEREGNIEVHMMGQTQFPSVDNARDRRVFNELRNFVEGLRRFDDVREITLLPGRNGVMAPTYNRG